MAALNSIEIEKGVNGIELEAEKLRGHVGGRDAGVENEKRKRHRFRRRCRNDVVSHTTSGKKGSKLDLRLKMTA